MLDTNAIGVVMQERGGARSRFERHFGSVGVSTIVLFELHYGLAKSNSSIINNQRLSAFLDLGIEIAPFLAADAAAAGRLRAQMEGAGKPMGPYDLLIAAHALRRNATLVTQDAGFYGIKNLRVADWTA